MEKYKELKLHNHSNQYRVSIKKSCEKLILIFYEVIYNHFMSVSVPKSKIMSFY